MENEKIITDDDRIVDLFLERDESAVGSVVNKYGKLLFTICNNITGNRQDAEECVNDTYLSVWNTIPPNKPYGRFKGYLCKTAINVSNNMRRKNKRHEKVQYSENMDMYTSDTHQREREEVRNKIDAINAFLAGIPKQDRLIFVKKYSFEYTDAQIAKEQNVSVYTVKNTLRRLKKELSKQLEKEESDE